MLPALLDLNLLKHMLPSFAPLPCRYEPEHLHGAFAAFNLDLQLAVISWKCLEKV
jgi:hypothetical protein